MKLDSFLINFLAKITKGEIASVKNARGKRGRVQPLINYSLAFVYNVDEYVLC